MFGSGQFRPLVVTRSLNGSATWTCYRPKDAPNRAHRIDGRFDMTWLLANPDLGCQYCRRPSLALSRNLDLRCQCCGRPCSQPASGQARSESES
jgi:hypothetical protein